MSREVRARALLAEMEALGVSLEDLIKVVPLTRSATAVPTVADYLVVVAGGYGGGTAKTYGSYWKLLVEHAGTKPVDAVGYDDCAAVVEAAVTRAKGNGGDGRSSRESCIAAPRAYFERARRAGFVTTNPAAELIKPRRQASRRRGLQDHEVEDVWRAVATVSRDPRWTCPSSDSTCSLGRGGSVRCSCGCVISIRSARRSGCERSSAMPGSSRCPRRFSPSFATWRRAAAASSQTTRSSVSSAESAGCTRR